jgi:hypothetical protein
MANPILVTGAAGRVGAVGRTITSRLTKSTPEPHIRTERGHHEKGLLGGCVQIDFG